MMATKLGPIGVMTFSPCMCSCGPAQIARYFAAGTVAVAVAGVLPRQARSSPPARRTEKGVMSRRMGDGRELDDARTSFPHSPHLVNVAATANQTKSGAPLLRRPAGRDPRPRVLRW